MKITFDKAYVSGDDLLFITEILNYDLIRLGYDEEHRQMILDALMEKCERENAKVEQYEYAYLF